MAKPDNNKFYMNEIVIIGCERHAQSCEGCQNIQNSQKSNLTCQLCEQTTYFCRSKPCQYKFHCLNK